MFAKRSVYDAHLPGKKHQKALQKQATMVDKEARTEQKPQSSKRKAMALLEHTLKYLMQPLEQQRTDSLAALERKQTLTADEYVNRNLEEEEDAALSDAASNADDDDEDDDKLYNPLKLPLGWDGKPIPFWLYKLHGLGVEFPCEICGNYVYMGRRAFEKHFQVCSFSWRSTLCCAHGAATGIPSLAWYALSRHSEHQGIFRSHQDCRCAKTYSSNFVFLGTA